MFINQVPHGRKSHKMGHSALKISFVTEPLPQLHHSYIYKTSSISPNHISNYELLLKNLLDFDETPHRSKMTR